MSQTELVGKQFGNYRLTRFLGKGGFANVYEGEHIHLHTLAAIKLLNAQLTGTDIESFRQEAETIAHLEHPNILRVLDFGIEDGVPFLVTDYASYGNLRAQYPRGTILPLTTIVPYANQVASALQYAHDQKVIHRDVKPENLLLGKQEEILLSDFGIAVIAANSQQNIIPEITGTAAYMAPELFQGKVFPASDQYALGVIVYEWLSGDHPFHGTFAELASQHMFVPVPPLHEKMPASSLPPTVEQVVQRALAKNPEERFPNIQDFAIALTQASGLMPISQPQQPYAIETVQSNQAISTPPPQFVPKSQAPQQLAPAQLASQASVPINTTDSPSLQPKPDPAPAGYQQTQSLPESDTHPPRQPLPASTPREPFQTTVMVTQSRIWPASTFILALIGIGLAVLAVLLAIGRIPFTLSGLPFPVEPTIAIACGVLALLFLIIAWRVQAHRSTQGVTSLSWSPDGSRMVVGTERAGVQIWNAATAEKIFTYSGHTGPVWTVAWSPDGEFIASAGQEGNVHVWEVATGKNVYTYRGHSRPVWSVAWSPDGSLIASGGDKTVQIWGATGVGEPLTCSGHVKLVNALAWSPDGAYIASGDGDEKVQVWDTETGKSVYVYRGHESPVYAVAWAPNGSRIASSGEDIQVWDMSDEAVLSYRGHTAAVLSVAWAPDSSRIATGSADHTVQVWDAGTGNNISTYNEHKKAVRAVVWSPNGRSVASGSQDKTVHIWQVE